MRYGPLAMTTRGNWLDEGLSTLAADGVPALRIDRLAAKLGVSKGSFYHHFAGMPAYQLAVLEHFEALHTTRLIDAVEAHDELDAPGKLRLLMDLVLEDELGGGDGTGHGDVETAVRTWALQDARAREAQVRIDAVRTGYLRRLLGDIVDDEVLSADLAAMCYLLLIGSGAIMPPLDATAIRRLWERTLALVPEPMSPRRRSAPRRH